jgi:hypothetical protein
MYCLCVNVYCTTVTGVNPIAVNKYIISYIIKSSHQGIEIPLAAHVGDGLHIWKVASNIFNKESQTADKGRSSNLEVGRGAKTPHRKNSTCFEM